MIRDPVSYIQEALAALKDAQKSLGSMQLHSRQHLYPHHHKEGNAELRCGPALGVSQPQLLRQKMSDLEKWAEIQQDGQSKSVVALAETVQASLMPW